MSYKPNLFGLGSGSLKTLAEAAGQPVFRANQLFEWLYKKRVSSLDEMTNLPKAWRAALAESHVIQHLEYTRKLQSEDGSVKYIFQLDDGSEIESVYMPMAKGVTLCLSSQVGCAQACSFCLTAKMGFIRNLSAAEIMGQITAIMKDQTFDAPFNVVMMGMGEPLLNLAQLQVSLEVMTAGLGLSPKRITVSTSGHVRNLEKLAVGPVVPRIAISLNASTDEQRNELMPVNLKWDIQTLMDTCRALPIKARERITFEYVLIDQFNDSDADAKRLTKWVRGIRCKVNLIPFNETESLSYRQPPLARIQRFHELLNRAGVVNTIRWSKGRDIGAACGQLARPTAREGARLRAH